MRSHTLLHTHTIHTSMSVSLNTHSRDGDQQQIFSFTKLLLKASTCIHDIHGAFLISLVIDPRVTTVIL